MLTMTSRARRVVLSIACALVVAAAGCGDDADSGGGAATQTTATAGETAPQDAILEDAAAVVAELYEGHLDGGPPSSGPPAQRDKTVWHISCGEAAEGCAQAGREMRAAGEVLGWDITVFDGRFNAENAYATGIRQAVAAGADGVTLGGVDCVQVSQALDEARQAGVVVVGAGGVDCDDEPRFDGWVMPNDDIPNMAAWFEAWGQNKAYWLVDRLGGAGTILYFHVPDLLNGRTLHQGFVSVTERCDGCEVVVIDVPLADLTGPAFAQRVDDALLKHPDVAAIHTTYDAMLLTVAPAVQRAGLGGDVVIIGGEGNQPNIALIRDGIQTAGIMYDLGWPAWTAADTLNRLFAGDEPQPGGYGFQAVDAERNLPEGDTGYQSAIDFRAEYTRVWSQS